MLSLTIIILTKNEENNIEKCIRSFKGIAQKVLVIDSFSNDSTVEISKSLGADVYQHEFISHSSQFNWALHNINILTDWIMRIDADEEITEELINELIVKLVYCDKNVNGFFVNRRRYFLGRWIKHGDVYPEKVLRIFRTGTGYLEDRIMDEHIVLINGETIELENDIKDKDTKDVTFWINKHNWYSNLEAKEFIRLKEEYNKENLLNEKLTGHNRERKRWLKNNVYYNCPLFFRPTLYFVYRYFIKLGFLDGIEGLIYHFLQGFWYRFLVDSKIFEYKRYTKREDSYE